MGAGLFFRTGASGSLILLPWTPIELFSSFLDLSFFLRIWPLVPHFQTSPDKTLFPGF